MDGASWITMALSGLARLAVSQRLGNGESLSRLRLAELMGTLVVLINGGREMAAELRAFAQEITALAEADAPPSEEQWAAMRARDAAARAALEEARVRLSTPAAPAPEPPAPPEPAPVTDGPQQ